MDWISRMVDMTVTTLHILGMLFLAYGAYLAIYRKDLWVRPGEPKGKDGPGGFAGVAKTRLE
jgi:hypothetical protein